MPVAAGREEEVLAAVDRLLDHIANGRLNDTLEAFTGDPQGALFGSEQGEVAIGPSELKNSFAAFYAKQTGARFDLTSRRVTVNGDVAWFVAEARVAIAGQVIEPYRLSGVLVRRDGDWRWALFNGSEPLPPRS